MDFAQSERSRDYLDRLRAFIATEVEPVEQRLRTARRAPGEGRRDVTAAERWAVSSEFRDLQRKAREAGLWNLFLPDAELGAGLSNVEYAPLAEEMGRSPFASAVFNCDAPDTGNMEVLYHYGSEAQKEQWLRPLLDGEIRSAFCMTEPDVASSDATNMAATAVVDGDEIVLDGRKWWSTGIGHPDCKVLIFMGLTDPEAHKYQRHSMVLVPIDTPGVKIERMLPTMGFFDEPGGHGEVSFTDVRLPLDAVIAGPGRGFEIAQGRLGPGRIHHCMRLVGLAERTLELACRRGLERTAFGKRLVDLGGNRERIADARIAVNQLRLLVLHAAWLLDTQGLAGARSAVSEIKVVAPRVTQQIVDFAIQIHGGGGLSEDFPFAGAWTAARALRLADGPDEVHQGLVARFELGKYA
ncbi:acyl-CoA dehydrogenase family protein [Rhodococcus sp. CH91]|uniref:acyl-CoA dehydrogenase family protein n=1 Tax=Rhodococcus sp. CH91 TaxID=2910256 RepID=UPI001F4A29E6|nr:acyl-CoA dehydrogenase family protein [Rhodococcus sp. CH91]